MFFQQEEEAEISPQTPSKEAETGAPLEDVSEVRKEVSGQAEETIDKEALRKAFPKDLFEELKERFGARWSDNKSSPDRIIVDSFETFKEPGSKALLDLDVFLKGHGIEIEKYTDMTRMEVTINGYTYEFFSRSARRFEVSRFDSIVDHNLHAVEKLLPRHPHVLYIGSFGDMRIKRMFPDAVYLDITRDMLDEGDIQADAHNLPFQNGSFDLVFFKDMHEPVLCAPRVVEEVKRVLKKGGIMFSTGTFELQGKGVKIEDPKQFNRKQHEKAKKEYKKQGFVSKADDKFKERDEIAVMQKPTDGEDELTYSA